MTAVGLLSARYKSTVAAPWTSVPQAPRIARFQSVGIWRTAEPSSQPPPATVRRDTKSHWSLKPADVVGERVAWHECKSAVIYRLASAVTTKNDRGLLVEKFVVACHGEPREFGRRVQAAARRRGLWQWPHPSCGRIHAKQSSPKNWKPS